MADVFVTRQIPARGIELLREAGHSVDVSSKDGVLTPDELVNCLRAKPYEAVLSLLTDTINARVLDATPELKIVANYAVGYNNLDLPVLAERGVVATNTPGVLTDTVAEYTLALILAVAKRIPEADRYTRALHYQGWAPELFLGSDLAGKTLGLVGAGRIGSGVARRAATGLGMRVVYHDVAPSPQLEGEVSCTYVPLLDDLLRTADVVSLHVPLLDSTRHLIDRERLALMKATAFLINTSRGPVVDEVALVDALQHGTIKGAGLDVFEFEPSLAHGLPELDTVVITPHIASASEETRSEMAEIAARNIIAVLACEEPPNQVGV